MHWNPCHQDKRISCAVLRVPLDYKIPALGETTIAYVKYSASHNKSAIDVLYNPGGPGGSGVDAVMGAGGDIAKRLGPGFNVIGFDPRGVSRSGPSLTCFPGDPQTRRRYMRTVQSESESLPEQFAYMKARGEFCTKANIHTHAKYCGTVAVVQDMNNFIDRNHAAKRLPGKARMYYYGASYGTVLGQTYAALFPERIGRMLLDGNVYGVEYYKSVGPSFIHDTDAAFASFFE